VGSQAAQGRGSLAGVGAVLQVIREGEGGRARWESREVVGAFLECLEGIQEAAAGWKEAAMA